MAHSASLDDKTPVLETFTGVDPMSYKLWRRKAQLMLASLPTTIGKEKHGAKLMQFVSGEAESLLETLDIEEICKTGGDKKVLEILDEKYMPRPRDLLHVALKTYFYDMAVKPGEPYQQFLARLDASYRKLREQEVELNATVRGYMLLKKLRLESKEESMVLTATKGSMDFPEIVDAIRSIFPEGKGSTNRTKEVFQTEESEMTSRSSADSDLDVLEVMEAIADEFQGREDDFEDEEVLETFESYAEVRKKIVEKKKARGFTNYKEDPNRWRLTGTMRGKIEVLKSKTRCHLCKKVGHWKRECPSKKGKENNQARGSGPAEVHVQEVISLEEENAGHEEVWEMFRKKSSKKTAWKDQGATGVLNTGFADTHASGNRQRFGETTLRVTDGSIDDLMSPTSENDYMVFQAEEVLSASTVRSDEVKTPIALGQCAVPDTACRRTLVGEETLQQLEEHIGKQGMGIIRKNEQAEFRFGNAETLVSRECAVIPAKVGRRRLLIRASVLPGKGKNTPLLLSKEFMKTLNVRLDLRDDSVEFGAIDEVLPMGLTERGHYAIPMFEFLNHECCYTNHEKNEYDISKMEQEETCEPFHSQARRDPACGAVPSRRDGESRADDAEHGPECHLPLSDSGSHGESGSHQRPCRRPCRHRGGWLGQQYSGRSCSNRREMVQERNADELQRDLCGGQGLCELDQESHQRQVQSWDAADEGLHSRERPKEESEDPQDAVGRGGRTEFRRLSPSDSSDTYVSTAKEVNSDEPRLTVCQDSASPSQSFSSNERGRVDGVGGPDLCNGLDPCSCRSSIVGEPRDPQQVEVVGDGRDGVERASSWHCGGQDCKHPDEEPGEVHSQFDQVLNGQTERLGKPVYESNARIGQSVEESAEKEACLSRKDRKRLSRNVECLEILDVDDKEFEANKKKEKWDVCFVGVDKRDDSVDLTEVFSVPRMTPVADRKGLKSMGSFDIENGWDFLRADHRKQFFQELEEKEPEVAVVSPPCRMFSLLQAINRAKMDPRVFARRLTEAKILFNFAVQVCQWQHDHGRGFILEQPLSASSWKEKTVCKLEQSQGVFGVVVDQCQYGLRDPENGGLYKKPTKFLTNIEEASSLHRKCEGNHEHQRIEGMTKMGGQWICRSRCAQVYPKDLVHVLVNVCDRYKKRREQKVLEVHASEFLTDDAKGLEASVRRAHVNLGHPSKERFIHMLKSAGAGEKAIHVAKELKCSTCVSKKLQNNPKVARTKKAEGFNKQVLMDVFDLPIYQQKVLKMLNIVDEGTGLQVCVPLWKGAKSSVIRNKYCKYWKRWAGNPVRVLTDGGQEFEGSVQQGFDDDQVYVEKIAAYSPWQNGVCERHGGLWKSVFQKSFEEVQPRNRKEVDELVDQVTVSKNSMSRKNGYAPYQHVFGSDLRIPGLISEARNEVSYNSGIVHGDEGYVKAHQMRQAARKAMVEMDDDSRIRHAVERRTRPERGPFEVGSYVYYWRRPPGVAKQGIWKGPARVIGQYDQSKLWVSHASKVLRCSPEQLRLATDDQIAAIRFTTPDLLQSQGRFSGRGPQTFVDITKEQLPTDQELTHEPPDREESDAKRIRRDDGGEMDTERVEVDEQVPMVEAEIESADAEIDTSTGEPSTMTTPPPEANVTPEELQSARVNSYGPVRQSWREHESVDLETARRRSLDLLDVGNTRVPRTPFAARVSEEDNDVMEVTMTMEEYDDVNADDEQRHFESFLVQQKKNEEVKFKSLNTHEVELDKQGRAKELGKLLQTKAVKIHLDEEAEKILRTVPENRFLGSRFVRTRRPNPEDESKSELKCRWVIQGYMDPDLEFLERQSPTLSADGLSMVLQMIASQKWVMGIADIEGAFLQGDAYMRDQGRVFARMPKEGFPDVPGDAVLELTKCVYGLMDAPRRWWITLTQQLVMLGMKQSELDPCVFYWFDNQQLGGIMALHVDDIVFGGNQNFSVILDGLRNKFPFKHWKKGSGDFLGRKLKQSDDGSIEIDQSEYSKMVEVAKISKERRKDKGQLLTDQETKQLRGIVGAANWIVGSSRPDLAAATAMLQQKIGKATIEDLIEANRLVARIRDFAHTRIWVRSIDLNRAVLWVSSDASWGNATDLKSQAGYMIFLADENLRSESWSSVSPLRWKSYKLDRATQSTLGSELMAAARAVSEGNWMRSLFAEARYYDYDMTMDKEFRQRLAMLVTIDNKPVYDHTHGDGVVVKDKRLAIDMLLFRKDMKESNTTLRWIDTRQMVSDVLTKTSASPDFLFYVLKFGEYIVVKETKTLEWRLRERELLKQKQKKARVVLK